MREALGGFSCRLCRQPIEEEGMDIYMHDDCLYCSVACRCRAIEITAKAYGDCDNFKRTRSRTSSGATTRAPSACSFVTDATPFGASSSTSSLASSEYALDSEGSHEGPIAWANWTLGAGISRLMSFARGAGLLHPPTDEVVSLAGPGLQYAPNGAMLWPTRADEDFMPASAGRGLCGSLRSSRASLADLAGLVDSSDED